jgi:hypothetical protein
MVCLLFDMAVLICLWLCIVLTVPGRQHSQHPPQHGAYDAVEVMEFDVADVITVAVGVLESVAITWKAYCVDADNEDA